ncbi:hypothetical protein GWI33_013017 [Rhynchophorus ferrugineus]|uniref:Uncharacterized protein n=1 Tax=Rhynchophorus ferrugineus TaxID=354439 RepID=A0A834I7W3_RHYFE|nr:hypothetical protein GWI33_013017 [Rhynchophorus ferrugineus]
MAPPRSEWTCRVQLRANLFSLFSVKALLVVELDISKHKKVDWPTCKDRALRVVKRSTPPLVWPPWRTPFPPRSSSTVARRVYLHKTERSGIRAASDRLIKLVDTKGNVKILASVTCPVAFNFQSSPNYPYPRSLLLVHGIARNTHRRYSFLLIKLQLLFRSVIEALGGGEGGVGFEPVVAAKDFLAVSASWAVR